MFMAVANLRIPTGLIEKKKQRCNLNAKNKLEYPWRIHGAGIYGVPWIPSTKTPVMLAYISAPWIRHGVYNQWSLIKPSVAILKRESHSDFFRTGDKPSWQPSTIDHGFSVKGLPHLIWTNYDHLINQAANLGKFGWFMLVWCPFKYDIIYSGNRSRINH